MVLKSPLAGSDLSNRSATFAATYLQVRSRVLPIVAQTMYGMARASFETGTIPVALAQFQDLLVLLEGDTESDPPLADLRMLAEGFVKLSRRRLEAATIPAAAPPAAPPVEDEVLAAIEPPAEEPIASAPESRPFAPWRPQIFGPGDVDVIPPVTIQQQMPSWAAPRAIASMMFNGLLEIVIREDGLVAATKIIEPSHPIYDAMLLSAASRWQYSPALKDGRPVKYRKVIDIRLRTADH
jgi:hypothetical protein